MARRPSGLPALAVLTMAAMAWGAPVFAAEQARPQEYEVKAAYLSSFGKFVAWPDTEGAAGRPFLVCVLGHDPFGPALEATLANTAVGARPVGVRRVAAAADARECQIVFISHSEDATLDATLGLLGQGPPVLTVGESPRFVERGGMVQFIMQASRVRFAVNVAAAEAAGLAMSSELIRVATSVIGGAPPGR